MARQNKENPEEQDLRREAEEKQRQVERKRLGPPHFSKQFAAQVPPEWREYTTDVGPHTVKARFQIRRLNYSETNQWRNAGQEISVREDKEAESGQRFQWVRDLDEEDSTLMKLGISDFEIPNGEIGNDGRPIIKSMGLMKDYEADELLSDLLPEVAAYWLDEIRAFNGFAVGNEGGGEKSSISSPPLNTNTAESTTAPSQEEE